MARIVVNSYMVRYPLGGMMSWVLQYLVGFHRLGHDVYFVEKSSYARSCYDAVRGVMTDDCSYGAGVVGKLLASVGLRGRWCFVDADERYHGLSRAEVERAFDGAVYIDMGTRGDWDVEAERAAVRVFVDGEPGFCQMKMEHRLRAGEALPEFEHYYSTGRNIGTAEARAPTGGKDWRPLFHPVNVDSFSNGAPPRGAPFTTVMNWQSHKPLEFDGRVYGQKDVEFEKFVDLPRRTSAAPLELAVSGAQVPADELTSAGWRLRQGHTVTLSYESFADYIRASRGEFSVCKNVFLATRSGWFSDRSAAYLASGRPVVMQDTGFSRHLPCGEGLFAVSTADEAAAAIETIEGDWPRHSAAAREIAREHLEATRVLGDLLDEIGV